MRNAMHSFLPVICFAAATEGGGAAADAGPKRTIAMKSKLVAKDLGNLKAAAALEEVGAEVVHGVIYGAADGISTRTDQRTGEVYEGLKGFFEGVPQDQTKEIIQAGICYLPGGFQEMVISQLKQKDGDGNSVNPVVNFAFTLATVKATNAAGYSFKLTPLMDISRADPLAALRAEVMQRALPAPKAAPAPKDTGKKK